MEFMHTRGQAWPKEVRERAVRMVLEHQYEHGSQWETICSVAEKLGPTPETVRKWVRRAEVDAGARPGRSTGARRNRLVAAWIRLPLPPDCASETAVGPLRPARIPRARTLMRQPPLGSSTPCWAASRSHTTHTSSPMRSAAMRT